MALVLDTGPLLAALDVADPDHDRCAGLLSEADYWCHQRLGARAWITFLEDLLAGAYRLEAATTSDLSRCAEIQRQYEDQLLGVVDASVLALVERLGESKLAPLDHRHFSVLRPAHVTALNLFP